MDGIVCTNLILNRRSRVECVLVRRSPSVPSSTISGLERILRLIWLTLFHSAEVVLHAIKYCQEIAHITLLTFIQFQLVGVQGENKLNL